MRAKLCMLNVSMAILLDLGRCSNAYVVFLSNFAGLRAAGKVSAESDRSLEAGLLGSYW